MINLVIIPSIINICNKPLSYTNIRSIYTPDERFEQTKKTISSVYKYIPNATILMIECSNLEDEKTEYLKSNVDIFLNCYDDLYIRNCTTSISKSLGECTQIMYAINYILKNNIQFDNLFKIGGRYYLTDNFKYDNFHNNNIIVKYVNDVIFTGLFKIPNRYIHKYLCFLNNNIDNMIKCIAAETLLYNFMKDIPTEDINNINTVGMYCLISVSNNAFEI